MKYERLKNYLDIPTKDAVLAFGFPSQIQPTTAVKDSSQLRTMWRLRRKFQNARVSCIVPTRVKGRIDLQSYSSIHYALYFASQAAGYEVPCKNGLAI